ncbi:MAG: hypothetical protein Q7T71_15190, partial [Herbiconiux sp.]|nr:hypothetical protein [Herbiconiux sp.]
MLPYTPTRLAPLVLALTGVTLLAGCASAAPAASSSAPVTDVTIVSGQSSQNGELLQSIFDDYNAQAGSDVVDLQLSADSDLDTAQKVLVDIAAGDGPDA